METEAAPMRKVAARMRPTVIPMGLQGLPVLQVPAVMGTPPRKTAPTVPAVRKAETREWDLILAERHPPAQVQEPELKPAVRLPEVVRQAPALPLRAVPPRPEGQQRVVAQPQAREPLQAERRLEQRRGRQPAQSRAPPERLSERRRVRCSFHFSSSYSRRWPHSLSLSPFL